MGDMFRKGLTLALATLLAGGAHAQTGDVAEPAFTAAIIVRLEATAPEHRFVRTGPLEIRVSDADGEESTLRLDRVRQFCARNEDALCEETVSNYVSGIGDSLKGVGQVTRERLRIAVREAEYCDQVEQMLRRDDDGPIFRSFAPGLCLLLMADYPRLTQIFPESKLDELGIAPFAAWAVARVNTLADLPRVDRGIDLSEKGVMISGEDYAPSLMLDFDGWRVLAARTDAQIVVMVPADNMIMIVRLDQIEDRAALQAATRDIYERAQRGVSPYLYRWTGSGWEVLD